MDKKEVEKLLYSYPYLVAENKNITLELERMDISGIKPITYDFKPNSSSKSSVVEVEVFNLEKKRDALKEKQRLNQITLDKIDSSLTALYDLEKEIVKRIYFKKFKSKDIAQQLYITHIYVSMLKRSALEKLTEIIK